MQKKIHVYLWPSLIEPAAPWFLLFLSQEEVGCADLQRETNEFQCNIK